MNNLNLKVFMVLTPTKTTYNIEGTQMLNVVYQAFVTEGSYIIDYYSLVKRMQLLKCEK
jgi:hypothetical protein